MKALPRLLAVTDLVALAAVVAIQANAMRKLLAVALTLSLASVANAGLTEDFEAGWSDGQIIHGNNGWTAYYSSWFWDNPLPADWGDHLIARAGVGYLGGRAVTIPVLWSPMARTSAAAFKSTDQTYTTGTFTQSALVYLGNDGNQDARIVIGDWTGHDREGGDFISLGMATAQGGRVQINSRIDGVWEQHSQSGVAFEGLGWIEWRIAFDLDNNTAVAKWRDVDDAAMGYEAGSSWETLDAWDADGRLDIDVNGVGIFLRSLPVHGARMELFGISKPAREKKSMNEIPGYLLGSTVAPIPKLKTGTLGGVPHPDKAALIAMQKGRYVLHARAGKLSKVPAEKTKLPHDPKGHIQAVSVVRAPDGSIYAKQMTIMCKSTDGGRTWSSYKWPLRDGELWEIRGDGRFISVGGGAMGETSDPLPVRVSKDEGRTWRKISEIKLPPQYNARYAYHMLRLPDDTLLCGIECRDHWRTEGLKWISGSCPVIVYHSRDGGKTWQGPCEVAGHGSEGGMARMASGKLLAVIRHQRPLLPTDPPDLVEKTGGTRGSRWPFKNVFLADSNDGGKTWTDFRPLTTVFGQTRGYPAGLSDGTVIVIHDTRYGPGPSGSRAMVSHNEGSTWEDEVYYVGGHSAGYNASVVLEDDLVLTINGKYNGPTPQPPSWGDAIGRSDLIAIRWKPVKD